ncbi:MAG: DNA primase [Betaproteobacteria bacterium]|nr:DNA primase [Betaproteobacteria bacterium]
MIPDSFKQDLLNRVDIVEVVSRYVQLKKGGANYLGLCPFHGEKTPSFTVSPAKQFYHCFGCGAHGNAIGFLMAYAGLGYVDALRDLAASVGMQLPESRPRSREEAARQEREADLGTLLEQAMNFYRAELKKSPRAIEYLKGRGLSGEIAARFRLGYAPDDWQGLRGAFTRYDERALVECGLVVENEGKRYDRFRDRIMFPIFSNRGSVIAFGGRVLGEGEPKYLNSPESPLFEKGRELYGLVQAREAIHAAGRVLVVEGYMDVISLAQHGVGYAVATLGTATTAHHVARLLRLADEVVFCFDGDAAGRKAAWRALEVSLPLALDHKPIRFLFLAEGEDPDSSVRAQGAEAFEQALREAQTLSRFLLAELRAQSDLGTPEGRSALLAAARPQLQRVAAPALRLQLVKEVAELARVSQDEAEQLLGLAQANAPRARPAPRRSAPPIASSQERNLLRCVLVKPALIDELDAALLDPGMPESAALRAIAAWAAEGGGMSGPLLIEHFRDSTHAERLFQAQAAVLEHNLSEDDAERQFRQIQLALRIQRKNEEFEALRREATAGRASRELMLEIDRRAKELAELKGQRL